MCVLRRLPPVLRPDDQSTILVAGLERGIPMYAKLCHFAKEECWMVDASLAANQLVIALESLMLQLLRSSIDPGMVDIIFFQLLPWTRGQEGSMRRAALTLLRLTLTTFVREVEFEPGAPTRFSQGHVMIARVSVNLIHMGEKYEFHMIIYADSSALHRPRKRSPGLGSRLYRLDTRYSLQVFGL